MVSPSEVPLSREVGADGTVADSSARACFCFGPMVNPLVRERRGILTYDEQPAILQDYRLTFHFGGVANVVHQRGFEVHGIFMKISNEESWKKLNGFDAGCECQLLPIELYEGGLPNMSVLDVGTESCNRFSEPSSISAYVFVLREFDERKLEFPIEVLPQERYLKLIAQGMRMYGADLDYIQDEIMGVPYEPNCARHQWKTFPKATIPLPKITFQEYQQLCADCPRTDLYFLVGRKVLKVGEHADNNPAAVWLQQNGHGRPDMTHMLHKTIIDPDMPVAQTADDITEMHREWAENQIVEIFAKCQFTVEVVYMLTSDEKGEENAAEVPRQRRFRWSLRRHKR